MGEEYWKGREGREGREGMRKGSGGEEERGGILEEEKMGIEQKRIVWEGEENRGGRGYWKKRGGVLEKEEEDWEGRGEQKIDLEEEYWRKRRWERRV